MRILTSSSVLGILCPGFWSWLFITDDSTEFVMKVGNAGNAALGAEFNWMWISVAITGRRWHANSFADAAALRWKQKTFAFISRIYGALMEADWGTIGHPSAIIDFVTPTMRWRGRYQLDEYLHLKTCHSSVRTNQSIPAFFWIELVKSSPRYLASLEFPTWALVEEGRFRAVSEQFPSSFRAVSEQFPISFRVILG